MVSLCKFLCRPGLILSVGEIEVRVNGQVAILVTGLTIRNSSEARIQGYHFQSFFGGTSSDVICRCVSQDVAGNKPDWASPTDQRAWFADISGAVISRR